MPTKQDFIDALSVEATAAEIEDEYDGDLTREQWLAEMMDMDYETIRYYYYYWRRVSKNFRGRAPRTFVRGNKIIYGIPIYSRSSGQFI